MSHDPFASSFSPQNAPQGWTRGNCNNNVNAQLSTASFLSTVVPPFQSSPAYGTQADVPWTNPPLNPNLSLSAISFDQQLPPAPRQHHLTDISIAQVNHTWPAPSSRFGTTFLSSGSVNSIETRTTSDFASVASSLGLSLDTAIDSLLKTGSFPTPSPYPPRSMSLPAPSQHPVFQPAPSIAPAPEFAVGTFRNHAFSESGPAPNRSADWPNIIPTVPTSAVHASFSPALSSSPSCSPPSTGTEPCDSVNSPPTSSKRKRLQSKRACVPCRSQKAACGSLRPCERCTRLGKAHLCVDHVPKKRDYKRKPSRPIDTASSPLQLPFSSSSPSSTSQSQSSLSASNSSGSYQAPSNSQTHSSAQTPSPSCNPLCSASFVPKSLTNVFRTHLHQPTTLPSVVIRPTNSSLSNFVPPIHQSPFSSSPSLQQPSDGSASNSSAASAASDDSLLLLPSSFPLFSLDSPPLSPTDRGLLDATGHDRVDAKVAVGPSETTLPWKFVRNNCVF